MKNRNQKDIGWIYLLSGFIDGEEVYKYGCTRKSVTNRKNYYSSKFKNKFKVIASFNVFFPYKAENDFKHWVMSKNLFFPIIESNEVIPISHLSSIYEPVEKMREISLMKKYFMVK